MLNAFANRKNAYLWWLPGERCAQACIHSAPTASPTTATLITGFLFFQHGCGNQRSRLLHHGLRPHRRRSTISCGSAAPSGCRRTSFLAGPAAKSGSSIGSATTPPHLPGTPANKLSGGGTPARAAAGAPVQRQLVSPGRSSSGHPTNDDETAPRLSLAMMFPAAMRVGASSKTRTEISTISFDPGRDRRHRIAWRCLLQQLPCQERHLLLCYGFLPEKTLCWVTSDPAGSINCDGRIAARILMTHAGARSVDSLLAYKTTDDR